MSHFFMGAINQTTNCYEYPTIANKKYKYKCPDCNKFVIFRKGKILKPHFAHFKSDNPCSFYNNPGESQKHKNAKMILNSLLNKKSNIHIYRNCSECVGISHIPICELNSHDYNNTSSIVEHKFDYMNSKKSADVALIKNETKQIKYIFEICHTHQTKESDRPEPWFEFNAEWLVECINAYQDEGVPVHLTCIRHHVCDRCKEQNERYLMENEELREKNRIQKFKNYKIKKENEFKYFMDQQKFKKQQKIQDEIDKQKSNEIDKYLINVEIEREKNNYISDKINNNNQNENFTIKSEEEMKKIQSFNTRVDDIMKKIISNL